jgi:hypothetical protein
MSQLAPYTPEPHRVFTREDYDALINVLTEQGGHLYRIMEGLNSHALRQNVDSLITVSNQPQTLSRNGRRHNMIWVSTTVTCYIDNLTGWGPFTLYGGWNVLDLAESARIVVFTATTFNALYRCTDFEISGAVV